MASPTKKLKAVRKNKRNNAGKRRKAQNNNKGTTLKASVLFGDE